MPVQRTIGNSGKGVALESEVGPVSTGGLPKCRVVVLRSKEIDVILHHGIA